MSASRISRRHLLGLTVKVGAAAMALPFAAGRAATRLPTTPGQVLGPFYPLEQPADHDADLVVVRGSAARAHGQVLHVRGRVLTSEGEPVPRAVVEVWQANAHGRYAHPSDPNPAPLDPNFQGFAAISTDAEGRFSFRTVKPGPYPGNGGALRAPHIHYQVTGRFDRLVTQMYFDGEPLNAQDRLLQGTLRKERLVVPLRAVEDGEPRALAASWEIVLPRG
jgi:protocatechuate 3,4-dioxygenase beta subunit